MDNRVVTEKGRERAAGVANSLRLGKTMTSIQDGATEGDVWNIAFSEYLEMHKNCPCCRGAQSNAKLIADHITSSLKDYVTDLSQAHC